MNDSTRPGAPIPSGDAIGARRGMLLAVSAFSLWGLFPLYYHLLEGIDPLRILAHRAVWAGVVCTALVAVALRGPMRTWWRSPGRPTQIRQLALTGALLASNWGVYIYAATRGHVVEGSLGYFICPLVTVALGVGFLGERLSRVQTIALGLAAAGVLQLVVRSGTVPFLGLYLALSFSAYGLLRKKLSMDPLLGSAVEAMLLAPFGLLWLLLTPVAPPLSAGALGLLLFSGPLTIVPLALFVMAAKKLPYTTVGLLNYITPTLQLGCGVLVGREGVGATEALAFALVWGGLALVSGDALRRRVRDRRTPVSVTGPSDDPSPIRA